MTSRIYKYSIPIMIGLTFLAWFFIFRHFVLNQSPLKLDAIAYFGHLRFYIHNLEAGVYPLWDPDWFGGAPVDFFLRRIGNFNPFFLLILVFHKIGFPFRIAYLLFLMIYFYLGMGGFYLLSRAVIKDRRAALFSFMLLCFSSLGGMLFFSFIHLVYVPLFWFFYFLFRFGRKPDKTGLLGVTFTLMIICSTYIPVYFLIIVLSFLFLFVALYFKQLPALVHKTRIFTAHKKKLVILCVCVLTLSCIPQALLFKSSSDGQMVMPARHQDSGEESIFTVAEKKLTSGDAVSQLYFDRNFNNHDKMVLGVVYFPVTGFFIFLLGAFCRIDKKTILLSLLGFFLFLASITDLSPVHTFLYKHFFVFKFIRQSYFFFWIGILPILALIVGIQLEKLLNQDWNRRVYLKLLLVSAVSLFCLVFLWRLDNVAPVTYLVLAACFAFSLVVIVYFKRGSFFKSEKGLLVFLFTLFLLVFLEPLNAFWHLHHNELQTRDTAYRYAQDEAKHINWYQRNGENKEAGPRDSKAIRTRPTALYYATRGYNYLFQFVDYPTLRAYLNYRFVLYDHVQFIPESKLKPHDIELVLSFKDNKAIVHEKSALKNDVAPGSSQPMPVKGAGDDFKIISFNVNEVKLWTNFDKSRFLVYNDSYHSDWHSTVNGVARDIYRTNVGYKGVWLPPGENVVVFHFKPKARYLFDYFLFFIFAGMLAALVYSWFSRPKTEDTLE